MPPVLSDDDTSDTSGVGAVTTPPASKRGRKLETYAEVASDDDNESTISPGGDRVGNKRDNQRNKRSTQNNGSSTRVKAAMVLKEESEQEHDEAEDEEEGDDEYEVQEIINHMLDSDGNTRFRVIWKGYEDPSDYTWEPEDNLAENASEILSEYILKIGGREQLFVKPAKGKKRSRQAKSSTTPTTEAKRMRTNENHPVDRESPSAVQKVFKPPAGSWENDVVDVEMFRGDDGELHVFLSWKDGNKSQHTAHQAYDRCPQKILRFYESRISFKTATE